MKTLMLALALLGAAGMVGTTAVAQGLAPTSIADLTAIGVITGGNGFFASSGAYRLALDRTGTTYAVFPLTSTLASEIGTYTYTKTGPNTARAVLTDLYLRIAVPHDLVFSSQTSASYTIRTGIGNQDGRLILENGVLQPTVSAGGFANMSVRAQVPVGGQVIPGLVLSSPTRVLVRVAGPALAAFGVVGALPNPRLVLMAGANSIAANDDWTATAANRSAVEEAVQRTGAFAFSNGSRDAAMVVDLAAGAYTCIINGEEGSGGEVLLEVYRVP